MAILTQILIILLVLALFYAVVIHNRDDVKKVVDLLPDFSKLRIGRTHHMSAFVKVVVYVPDAHAEAVRDAIAEAGGGMVGHYSHCSFSSQGIGRYLPEAGAHPSVGMVGKLELVEEERIEITVAREKLSNILAVIKKAHPYEETPIDIYSLESL